MYVNDIPHYISRLIFYVHSITEGLSPQTWQARLQWWLTNAEGGDPFTQRVLLVASSGAGKFS